VIPRAKSEGQAEERNQRHESPGIVARKPWSGLTRRRLPEFALLRGAEFFAGPFAAVAGKAVEMSRGPAGGRGVFPTSFEPTGLIEAHENRIKRSGGDAGLTGNGVAVMPLAGTSQEGREDVESLMGDTEANAHGISLHR